MSKVKNIISRLIESPGIDSTGMGKQISNKESSITKSIREFLQSNFKKTKIALITCTGEVWEINLEAPVSYKDNETGIQKRETAKNVAYDHRDKIQKFLEDKYNFTPCSVGGLDAQGNTCKFLIQFTLRNIPGKELVENLLRSK